MGARPGRLCGNASQKARFDEGAAPTMPVAEVGDHVLPLRAASCYRHGRGPGAVRPGTKSLATWRSGYAAVCKTVYPGSIPGVASTLFPRACPPLPSSFLLAAAAAGHALVRPG